MYTTIAALFSLTQFIHAQLRTQRGLGYSARYELVQSLYPYDEGRVHGANITLSGLPPSTDNATYVATSYLEEDGGLTGAPDGPRTGSSESLQ